MGPNCIVIGSMKSATSTISAYLEDHPDAFMVKGLDPNYFSDDTLYETRASWYEGLFAAAQGERVIAENSNNYSNVDCFPHAAERIARFNPAMKIVYMVRHPVERIRSQYVQRRADTGDGTFETLDKAIRLDQDGFIGPSRYWKALSVYRDHFPDSQIFVGFMEDLWSDRTRFFKELTGFIGIDHLETKRRHQNASRNKRVPSTLFSAVRKLPLAKAVSRTLPGSLSAKIKRDLLSKDESEIRFSDDALAQVLDDIRSDSRQFLAYCGKPADFWGSL